jgi:hypothetical protein
MDKFDAIRAAGIDGLNYDLDTEDIIDRLKLWDDRYGINIAKVQAPSFTITFTSLPEALQAFADEITEFCPDIVFQGVGDPAALAELLRDTYTLFLWWD